MGAAAGPGRSVDPEPGSLTGLVPAGAKARFAANLAAIRLLDELDTEDETPTLAERRTLAAWSGWGAVPQVFDDSNPGWAEERDELRSVLDDAQWAEARRSTVNAHYTDPVIVSSMWDTLKQLGFAGGAVLEPGCGSGNFIAAAPPGASMVGVELDTVTARVAAALHPDAVVRAESFADSPLEDGSFDAAIGNVPFADVALYDKRHNPAGHSIHNHFIIKSLALTRPGGLVAVVTSSYTMDARNPAARRDMLQLADLVGAVRLPSGAHRRTAGTDVVTDILVFRRRHDTQTPQPFTWERSLAMEIGDSMLSVNNYFVAHPDHVLGTLAAGHGLHRDALTVQLEDLLATLPGRLTEALQGVVDSAVERGLTHTPAETVAVDAAVQESGASQLDVSGLWDGTVVALNDSGFATAAGGVLTELKIPKTQTAEVTALIGLRDGTRALMELEASTAVDTAEIGATRDELLAAWQGYVATYGPINRYTLRRTGRVEPVLDEITGEPVIDEATGAAEVRDVLARITPPAVRIMRSDPFGALLLALERFDDETHTATPAHVLTGRMVAPRHTVTGVDTPAEAVAVCLDQLGHLDLDRIASLLGVEPDEVRGMLDTLVFDDPATGGLVPEAEYLSGDVRTKLDQARAAAETDPRFTTNVEHLAAVQPDPIPMEDIQARLGAVWIPPVVQQQFLRETLRDAHVIVENPLPGQWKVSNGYRFGFRATQDWGTTRVPGPTLAEKLMNQTSIVVKDSVKDGPEMVNPVETAAAQEKAEALQERFAEWVWEEPTRAAELWQAYNKAFNSIVLRDYSKAGEQLTFPGLAESLKMRDHQRAAVARMIAEPAVGLFHQVGAGKTLEMIAGVTELRRLGLIRKPLVVVPNHMLEQFSREWLQAYPRAAVLAASSADLTKDKRREFVARAAANDWDGIIMTKEAFKAISMSPSAVADHIGREVEAIRASLEAARNGGTSKTSIKQIEKAVQRQEELLKKQLDIPHDPGLTFEATGVDYLVVDEAHFYKNLKITTSIQGVGGRDNQGATDLLMKLDWLRAEHGNRVATLATATPLANSVTEAYTMQRYLRPDLLDAAGLTSFDGWAATFGQTVTGIEMGPAGGFRVKQRLAKFQNVPELLRMWHVFADVKTGEDLNLPVPQIAPRLSDGKREIETIVLDPTPELADYIADIAERAKMVEARQVDADQDNMLLISTDGRKAALDMRMIDPDTRATGQVKLDAVADTIHATWAQHRDNRYSDPVTGDESSVPGGLQLVFSDLGTPGGEKPWNAYQELKRLLAERGMPPGQIRFIHDARNDQEKARLFAAARAGHIAVLMGSTQKMGVGTNVQNRVVALHHIDCPWRPADIEQRDGRAIRQGNQNPDVAMYRYVVERSFDAYSWQTVARKAEFIAQVMKGRLDTREIDDIGDQALSAAEAKALASGNPLIMEKAAADNDYQKLRRQHVAYQRAQTTLSQTVTAMTSKTATLTGQLERARDAEQRTIPTSGDQFTIRLGETRYDTRSEAAQALAMWAARNQYKWINAPEPMVFGNLGGHDLTIAPTRDLNGIPAAWIALKDVPRSGNTWKREDLYQPSIGAIRALENKTSNIGKTIERLNEDLRAATQTRADAQARVGVPFAKTHLLDAAKQRLDHVNDQLAALARRTSDEPPQATPTLTDALGRPHSQPSAGQSPVARPEAIRRPGETPADAINRVAAELDRSQRPPHQSFRAIEPDLDL